MWVRILVVFGLLLHVLLNAAVFIRLDYRISWYSLTDLAAVLFGIYCTDFITGFIHWLGDAEIAGKWKLLQRFHELSQLHHKRPLEILERSYFDIKGNIALLYAPPLIAAAFFAPFSQFSPAVFFCLAVSNLMLLAHSIHKWCHQKTVHPFVAFLQRTGIIVSRQYHLRHHVPPYARNFAGINGWSSAAFEAIVPEKYRV